MNDNILILGAGASYDAGIPLMNGFMQTIWELAVRNKYKNKSIEAEDKELFSKVIEIRDELDRYHGRANFDDRNIEDILSILTFNLMEGKKKDKEKLNIMVKAISKMIDITCNVEHPGKFDRIITNGPDIYRIFWKALFDCISTGKTFPTIITFNYDLVLERSLLQLLINKYYSDQNSPPFKSITIKYYYDLLKDINFNIEYVQYHKNEPFETDPGTSLEKTDNITDNNLIIEILKLHGSINFPTKKPDYDNYNIASSIDNPFILPPIYNKNYQQYGNKIWKLALERLREAKNIVIIGYSLPQTDIYIQYFFKAALGPNLNLNNIFVFDPILYNEDNSSQEMKKRYETCFSPQLKKRIIFNPDEHYSYVSNTKHNLGKFINFVNMVREKTQEILF
jgi:hypothetical protein